MKTSKKAQKLLAEMASIQEMERGTVCKMKGRNHFNHQTWQQGRNVVRYVHRDEVVQLRQAIQGYKRFMALAQQYADEIIRLSRRERKKMGVRKTVKADTEQRS